MSWNFPGPIATVRSLGLCLLLVLAGCSGNDGQGADSEMEWLPSWATSIQGLEDKPDHQPPITLEGNTLRQFLWPTFSGETVRIQLSNEKGEAPLEISRVHLARAATGSDPGNSFGQIDASSDVALTFDGEAGVTIPPGQTAWSDPVDFPLRKIELTAISIQFGNRVPGELSTHPGSRATSYFAEGDRVSQPALPGAQTRDRWYLLNALEVMAPPEAFAIAVLGDSITDGYGVLNAFQRWPDFLTLAIEADPELAGRVSVLNFGMGANNLTISGPDQDSGLVRFERDVLPRDKIRYLVVLEGVNDIKFSGVQAKPIIDAYRQIVDRAHAAGITVYGSTITPMSENNPVRNVVNASIRNDGYFDAVIDLDAAIRDPVAPDNIAQEFDKDGLHPNVAGYEAMGRAVDLSLFKL